MRKEPYSEIMSSLTGKKEKFSNASGDSVSSINGQLSAANTKLGKLQQQLQNDLSMQSQLQTIVSSNGASGVTSSNAPALYSLQQGTDPRAIQINNNIATLNNAIAWANAFNQYASNTTGASKGHENMSISQLNSTSELDSNSKQTWINLGVLPQWTAANMPSNIQGLITALQGQLKGLISTALGNLQTQLNAYSDSNGVAGIITNDNNAITAQQALISSLNNQLTIANSSATATDKQVALQSAQAAAALASQQAAASAALAQQQLADSTKSKDNMFLYAGIGVVVLAILFFIFKEKESKN